MSRVERRKDTTKKEITEVPQLQGGVIAGEATIANQPTRSIVQRVRKSIESNREMPREVRDRGKEAMDVATAKSILETVVEIDDRTITSLEQTLSVGEYDGEKVREAFGVVVEYVISIYSLIDRWGDREERFDEVEKEVKDMVEGIDRFISLSMHDNTIGMTIQSVTDDMPDDEEVLVEIDFDLQQQGDESNITNFIDWSLGKEVSLSHLSSVEDVQQLVRGIKCLADNLLHWGEPRIIMPNNGKKKENPF